MRAGMPCAPNLRVAAERSNRVYSRAEKVFIDGAIVFDRADQRVQPRRDFLKGMGGGR